MSLLLALQGGGGDATASGSIAAIPLSAATGNATGSAAVNGNATGALAAITLTAPTGTASAAAQQKSGGSDCHRKPPRKKRGKYEVDRFSDFERKPIVKRNDDDELMLIFMMQGG